MKKICSLLSLICCLLLLCSCGSNTTPSSGENTAALEQQIADLQSKVSELEKENNTLREENNALRTGGTNPINNNTSSDSPVDVPPTSVTLNSPFSIGEVMEVTMTGAEWSDAVLPSDTSKTYSYYKDTDGETYFIAHGTILSNASDSFDIRWCSDAKIIINGKYSFSATMEFEDIDGRGFGESIKPLQTRHFIIYSSVSDEVFAISESVTVNVSIPNIEEQLNYFYDNDHSNTNFTITFDNLQH